MANKQTNKSLQIASPNNLPAFNDAMIEELIKSSTVTGIKSKGEFYMFAQKAHELGIGWANAVANLHFIQGKIGINIHILRAIIAHPKSGIRVELTKDFSPVYKYTDGNNIFSNDTLPDKAIILPNLSGNPDVDKYRKIGKIPVAILPTVKTIKGKQIKVIEPVDYITEYIFTRKKKDIDGTYFTEIVKSAFSWQDALTAKLPFDKAGQLNDDSAWYKYRKLMMRIRAYSFGAREIAGDLILGNYETTEILDMNDIEYSIDENTENVTIIDVDDNNQQ